MKQLLCLAVVVALPLFQVAVSPLFPISGANCDFALVGLALIMVFLGPRAFMFALPSTALLFGFGSDHSPGLLLLANLPLLPLAAYLADLSVPLNRYTQTALASVATGLFARALLSMAATAQGADFALSYTLAQVLIPGALLDAGLLTVLYFPLRSIGWAPQPTSLQRGGF